MQFQVPQFIEVEDKIFGPLTFKQFLFIAGGAGGAYLLWRALPLFIAAPFALVIGGLAFALAFGQYNGRPFLLALENAFNYLTRSKLYLWSNVKHAKKMPEKAADSEEDASGVYIPHLSDSKLHDLAWSLDIKERLNAGIGDADDRDTHDSVAPMRTPGQIIERLKHP
jgi:hypothetical protein